MKNLILPKTLLATGLIALLAACAPQNAKIEGRRDLVQEPAPAEVKVTPKDELIDVKKEETPEIKPLQDKWISQDGGQQLELKPQLDVLFVIDNSDSMKEEQENLARNINYFVKRFGANGMIDFHIGVTSVWDSSPRFQANMKKPFVQGELRRAKDGKGQTLKSRFVYRFENFQSALANTLKIGIAPYKDGGPETEEVLSPISAAIKNSGKGQINEGFFRDEAQLVVIMMTDADDSSRDITPSQLAEDLIAFKGDAKKVSVYGVLVKAEDPDKVKDFGLQILPRYHPECFEEVGGKTKTFKNNGKCTGFGPTRLEEFVVRANKVAGLNEAGIKKNFILSLNQKNYGVDLARIGSDITTRTMEKRIRLDYEPKVDASGNLMIRVRYGLPKELAAGKGQIIPQGPQGWLYGAEKTIVLSGDVNYQYKQGARIQVDYATLNFGTEAAE